MSRNSHQNLRRGWTTGACATAATKAALQALWGGDFPSDVMIALPKGETPRFEIIHRESGDGWAEAGVRKDAGDDPDVTHGALIIVRVERGTGGVSFHAGSGVGTITKPGLPIAVGEPAINPKPREMMIGIVKECAAQFGQAANISITISIPGGEEIATKTWNPRLGIVGGLSVLGTTGIVRPFSCSAWIASIHRGIDVARAIGLDHLSGCTGSTSEASVQSLHQLPDEAMLDMGDFVGGVLKYLKKHPVKQLTIGGGIGKITKLAQGAMDLHSARSQVDFAQLNAWSVDAGLAEVRQANTALEAVEIAGIGLAQCVANKAKVQIDLVLKSEIETDVVVIDRTGKILAKAGRA